MENKKKTITRKTIRQIVREEVAMAINEVITELKQPVQQVSQPQPKKKILEKKLYSSNSILNDVLNETANGDSGWDTMGGTKFTSERMNELVGGNYMKMMGDDDNAQTTNVNTNDPMSQFLNKDYSEVLKKVEEKDKMKQRG